MAKKVTGQVKLQIPAGKATPAPPVGTALGPQGVNIMEFCKAFNAKTSAKDQEGLIIPVVITIYSDRSFHVHHEDAARSHSGEARRQSGKGIGRAEQEQGGKNHEKPDRGDRQDQDARSELLHARCGHGTGEGRLPQHGRGYRVDGTKSGAGVSGARKWRCCVLVSRLVSWYFPLWEARVRCACPEPFGPFTL